MKKILSSKKWLLINLLGVMCFTFASVYSTYMCLSAILENNNLWKLFLVISVFSFLILVLWITALNRLSCIVWCDGKSIGRKGLLFGFKYQISLQEIKDITITFVYRQDEYVVIIDDYGNSIEGWSKKSYIRFENSYSNKDFYELIHRAKNMNSDLN